MSTITEQLEAAVAARKDSLKSLRERIAAILAPIPVGVTLRDDAGDVCKIVRVCTGASQWSNRTWEVTIHGRAALASGKLLCEDLADSKWDGNNTHYRKSEGTCLRHSDEPLKWLSGRETRELAKRLPGAIVRYLDECRAEERANNETAAAI
jgi:hypothetical protein